VSHTSSIICMYSTCRYYYTDHAAVKAGLGTLNLTGKHARWWSKVYVSGIGKRIVILTHYPINTTYLHLIMKNWKYMLLTLFQISYQITFWISVLALLQLIMISLVHSRK